MGVLRDYRLLDPNEADRSIFQRRQYKKIIGQNLEQIINYMLKDK